MLDVLRNGIVPNKRKVPVLEPGALSAQQFLNVKDIRGRVLYTKDGYLFAYLRIQPISVDLLSNSEKQMLIRNLSAELSTLDKPFKLFCISRPVDISGLIDEHMELYAGSDNAVQKTLLEQEIRLYKQFSRSGDTIERQFYLILWDRAAEDAEYALNRRAKELAGKFRSCGIQSDPLGEAQIIALCNLFANPSCAHLEDADVSPGMPLLKDKKGETAPRRYLS